MTLARTVEIAGRRVADDAPVYIIGEMACGHQGDMARAFALVDAAVKAEADCIQLQIFDTAVNMAPTSPLFGALQKLQFSAAEWRQIMAYARESTIAVSIFAYDESSLDLALELKPDMLKLNSSELANPVMIIGAARSGLPFTIGTGASTLNEIRRAVEISLRNGSDKVILMHGVQNFPTPIETANIGKIRQLKDEFEGLVVYADHTNANEEVSRWIDFVAIGQGAALLEKHLIVDRSQQGVDWQAALEPAEFAEYVRQMRQASAGLGPYDFQPFTEGDRKYRRFQKKSMVAARQMRAGERVTRDAIMFLRVQGDQEGIAPIDFDDKAEGRRVTRDIARFDQVLSDDLENDARTSTRGPRTSP